MDIKELIGSHQSKLDQSVVQKESLSARLKECAETGDTSRRCTQLRYRLVRWVLVYVILTFIITGITAFLINETRRADSLEKMLVKETGSVFQPHFPGSISSVLEEVLTWEEWQSVFYSSYQSVLIWQFWVPGSFQEPRK